MRALFLWLFALIHLSCGGGSSGQGEAVPGSISLARQPDQITALELPQSSRPRGKDAPKKWAFQKGFVERKRVDDRVEYLAEPPFRAVFYAQESGRRPPGLQVFGPGGEKLSFRKQLKGKVGPVNTWGWTGEQIVLRLDASAPEPDPKSFKVRFPVARGLERSLNLKSSGLEEKDFALRTLPLRRSYEHGVFLPAPATVDFSLRVPKDGKLKTTALLMVPAVQLATGSDGARLVIEAEFGGKTQELVATDLKVGAGQPLSVDLSSLAGRDVVLRIRTEPGKSKLLDYVFLKEPVVYTPSKAPQRVVVAFIDTLRQDRLGAYGHDRDTSPTMDLLAQNGVKFTDARAPSPWTRPSALGALYGVQPEDVAGREHIGEILAQAGYATGAFVSNTWVTGRKDLGVGWTSHRAVLANSASRQVKSASQFFKAHADQDALVMVHFIDPHLPYLEPKKYKTMWAGEAPKGLKGRLDESAARKAYASAKTDDERAAIRTHVLDRYDQNIRLVDDALKQLVKVAGPDALVVVFSDHGEEFWERGGFEHGHTLYDELMKVPLIIKSPKLTSAEVDVPVSLLDIVPTMLELLDSPVAKDWGSQPDEGWSLVDAAKGNAESLARFTARPIAIGRTMFGDDQWGVVSGGNKWIHDGVAEHVYALAADPDERVNTNADGKAETGQFSEALGQALGRGVERVLRVSGPGKNRTMSRQKILLELTHPKGVARAWTRDHPLDDHTAATVKDGAAVMQKRGQKALSREMYVKLNTSPDDLKGLTLRTQLEDEVHTATHSDAVPVYDGRAVTLLTAGGKTWPVKVNWTIKPLPAGTSAIQIDPEVTHELKALGYIEDDGDAQ